MTMARPALLSLVMATTLVFAQDTEDGSNELDATGTDAAGQVTAAPAEEEAVPEGEPDSGFGADEPREGPLPPVPTINPDAPPLVAPAGRSYVALVVGISAYRNLQDAAELNFGRADAATVRDSLKNDAGFEHVVYLGDGEASKANILEQMQIRLPQLVGPEDVFLFYFVGHGVGADFGMPVLLASDSTVELGHEDGFELTSLARDLQSWIKAGTVIIVTDASHKNNLAGISFYGPAASDWPTMPPNWMILSASESVRSGKDGAFGKVFAEGIGGAADANRDGNVTAAELHAYVVGRLAPTGQVPVAAGKYPADMILAQDVRGKPTDGQGPEKEAPLPDWSVSAAKFVWATGAGQTVQCRDKPVTACAPSCYVRDFMAGPCKIRGIFEGNEFSGKVVVLGPGKYDCERKGGELVCSGP
jgi:hypothetical protein